RRRARATRAPHSRQVWPRLQKETEAPSMRAFDRSLVRDVLNAPSERLGLFRAALGGYLAIYFVLRLPGAWHTMNSSVAVFEPAGLVDWVGVEKVPPVGVSAGIYLATLLLSVAFAFGAHFKWTGPL